MVKRTPLLAASLCLGLILLPPAGAQTPPRTITFGNLIYTVVDDPSPSTSSDWGVEMENGKPKAVYQRSNIFRTDREYEFWQGTHIVAGYASGMSDYNWGFDCRAGDDDGWGAIVRYQDADNYYRFITVQDPTNGGPFRRLEKFVDGKRIVLAESKEGYTPGEVHTIRMSAFGSQLDVYLDKAKILSAVDKSFSQGKFGILTYACSPFTAWNLSHWTDNR